MNAIAFCLDLILASLLLAALFVGLRLDRKLKALKESQAGFVGAVAELDTALIRAQDSLGALKSAAAHAEIAVADRIQDARGATARLDQLTKAAGEASEKLERLLERYPSSAGHSPTAAHPAAGRDPAFLELRDRASEYLQSRRPIAREALSRAAPEPKSPAPRPRTASDDDLFELIEPALRAARGGAR